MKRVATWVVFVVLGLLAGVAQGTDSWNLAGDWSAGNNPNGPWTYLAYHTTPATPYNVFRAYNPSDFPLGENGWSLNSNPNYMGLAKMVHDQTGGGIVPSYYAGTVVGHTNQAYDARWIAPRNLSNVTISGGIYKLRTGMGAVFVTLIVDGATMINQVRIGDGANRSYPYPFSFSGLTLNAGAVVDLRLNSGGENGDYGGIVNYSIVEVPLPNTGDLQTDWSNTNNPHNQWSYGGGGTNQGASAITFTLASTPSTTWMPDLFPPNGGRAWLGGSIIGLAKADADAATIDIKSGDVFAHAGGVFRWTAPEANTIRVAGNVWRTRNSDSLDIWLLENGDWNNNSAAQRHHIGSIAHDTYPRYAPLTYDYTFDVAAGQNVQLVIGGNDFCGVNMTVIKSPGPIHEYYVATDGNDLNAGALDSPFKTMAHARDVVRGLVAAGLTNDVVVYLRGGTYYQNATLQFGPEDSGTTVSKITYKSYPGEHAVISGGQVLTGWTSIGNSKYTTTLSDVASGAWWFRQLWRDDTRCLRARTNNTSASAVSADKKTITLSATPPAATNMVANKTELVMLHTWSSSRVLLSGDINGNVVTTGQPNGIPDADGKAMMATVGNVCYLEHHPAYIDQDTEWHLNAGTGLLTIQCAAAPSNYTIVAPRISKLITIRGNNSSTPVRNLYFEGISFKHTGLDMLHLGGYAGFESSINKTPNNGTGTVYTYIMPPAVQLTYAEDCAFERCHFTHLAQTAIGLAQGANSCSVVDCEIDDAGGAGVDVGYRGGDDAYGALFGSGTVAADADFPSDAPQYNLISNNYIHNCAVEWFGIAGVTECFTSGTEISKNIITDLPYTGLASGFRWDDTATSESGMVIKNNHIHDVMKLLDDGGGIKTNGNHQGGLIQENLIYDVWDNVGLYSDQGSSYFTVQNNIVYNCAATPLFSQNYYWHCNWCIENTFTWGTNYWDDDHGSPGRPQWIIDGAGVAPGAPLLNASLSECDHILIRGSCEPWSQISSAVVQETLQNISGYLSVGENGSIYGIIPKAVISSTTATVQVVVSDPDGDLSGAGISNAVELHVKGDINNDCTVSIADLTILSNQWLVSGCILPEWCSGADLDRNGKVDLQDFSLLGQHWMQSQ